jgi:hypothetical protein
MPAPLPDPQAPIVDGCGSSRGRAAIRFKEQSAISGQLSTKPNSLTASVFNSDLTQPNNKLKADS